MTVEPDPSMPRLALDPFSPQVLENPFPAHAALRDAGPVVWLPAIGCYAMARFDHVQAALKNWQIYGSGRGVGLSDFARETPWRPPSLLLETDPPIHDRTRGLMNRVASLAALRKLMPQWQEKAMSLVSAYADGQPFDAIPAVAEGFPLSVFPDLIGLRDEGRDNLIPYATVAFNAFGPRNALLAEAMKAAEGATLWVAESCKRENLKPGGWGMQVYQAADDGLCTHDEAERLVRSFLTAGVDTTVNGIATLLHGFAQFPGEYQRLRGDRALLRKAIEESLRWGGTIQTFFRTTSQAVEVEGNVIPEGAKVLLFLAAANRDPRHWDQPERFDIGRNASGHVGFGFGIHQCLGQMVARMEMEAMTGALLAHVAEIRATGPIEYRLNNTLRAIGALPIAFVPA
ncbi:cytochrome P450 [Sphingobium sp. HBC34]|uniref:Cytochrome P450 n=2 Tax=Sphingobium cyanobacteriorum TaxID=3063954 RepID=A0ABT8ZNZ1_9SPHN|nr:cytochrome P450 [Sphingobium sp. HBC34]